MVPGVEGRERPMPVRSIRRRRRRTSVMTSADRRQLHALYFRVWGSGWVPFLLAVLSCPGAWGEALAGDELDAQLAAALAQAGFTGRIESTLEPRLGRPINRDLADLGRLLW